MKKSTNHKKGSIGIVIVAAMMLLLLAGMILAPTQASALSKFNTNTEYLESKTWYPRWCKRESRTQRPTYGSRKPVL